MDPQNVMNPDPHHWENGDKIRDMTEENKSSRKEKEDKKQEKITFIIGRRLYIGKYVTKKYAKKFIQIEKKVSVRSHIFHVEAWIQQQHLFVFVCFLLSSIAIIAPMDDL